MLTRRRFVSLVAATAAIPARLRAGRDTLALYASVGGELSRYAVNVDEAALIRQEAVTLPAGVQYAWPHASRRVLYVASSNGGPGARGDAHAVQPFRIDPSGALQPHGAPIALRSRPIHLTTDVPSNYLLVAYNDPSAVTLHRINRDATLGEEMPQPRTLDAGIYAHQVRVAASNRMAILVTRGNDASRSKPEDPGALKVFRLKDGLLADEASIAPGGGYGFGPRHLDFHPSGRWIYVSLERQNQIWTFQVDHDTVKPEPLFKRSTLANPARVQPRQLAGTIHVHPGGRFVYGVNRADGTAAADGTPVFNGGENSIAVYALNERTGEPTLVQHADTHGFHARTFHIDPGGRLLVAANLSAVPVRDGATVRVVPANLAVFTIGGDGRLTFVRKYDIDVSRAPLFWMGMVSRPGA